VDATIHWVSAAHAVPAEVRLYDRLFSMADPSSGESDITASLNPNALEVLRACQLEPSLAGASHGSRFQFERAGYFCVDALDSSDKALVFNRTATLRDSWAKLSEKKK